MIGIEMVQQVDTVIFWEQLIFIIFLNNDTHCCCCPFNLKFELLISTYGAARQTFQGSIQTTASASCVVSCEHRFPVKSTHGPLC